MQTKAKQILILIVTAFIMGQVWWVIPNFREIILKETHLSDVGYRFLFLPEALSAIFMANIIGHIDYYFGTKRGLLISLLLATAGVFLVAIANGEYHYFLFAQICIGAAIAGTMSALSILSAYISPKLPSALLLVLFASLILGGMAVPTLLEYFLKHHTWQEVPLYIGFMTILFYMLVQLFVEDVRSEDHPKPRNRLFTIWKKIPLHIFLFLLLIFFNTISQTLIEQLGGNYLSEVKEVSEKEILRLLTSYFLAMGIGALVTAIIDTFTPTKIIYPILAGFVLLGYILLPFATESYQIFIATSLIGIGVWSILPLTIFYIHRSFPQTEEISTSLLISVYFIGVGISKCFYDLHHEALRHLFHAGILTAIATLLLSLVVITKQWASPEPE